MGLLYKMIETLTKKQHEEHIKKLIQFCKDDKNYCLMYNYMRTIEQIRKEPEDKLMMERLKKQADDYQRAEKLKKRAEKQKKGKINEEEQLIKDEEELDKAISSITHKR